MEKAIINAIRGKERVPNSAPDCEIAREYKGTRVQRDIYRHHSRDSF